LLLDENLSERLVAGLAAAFDEVLHVRTEGLGGASDAEIWGFALQSGATLVTKDEDFLRLSMDRGWPQTASFLLANVTTLQGFMDQQECGFLLLQPKP
jgi:predicted nuclease of predicted toxin-antitoxin system